MTLKQFGELALGVIVAVIVYATNLPIILKWPLIALFGLMGVVAAFVPIAERPLDHWLLAFFRALYKPTLFFWKKSPNIPPSLIHNASKEQVVVEQELDLSPHRKQRIREYIHSVSRTKTIISQEEKQEKQRVAQILEQFEVGTTTPPQGAVATKQKPTLGVRVRQVQFEVENLNNLPVTKHTKQEKVVFAPPPSRLAEVQPQSAEQELANAAKSKLAVDQVAHKVEIPETTLIEVDKLHNIDEVAAQDTQDNAAAYIATTHTPQNEVVASSSASFNTNLPFPTLPSTPNTPVGMVLDGQNNLLSGVIVEIQTTTGAVARAVKTNKLGQFSVSTPLKDGEYVLSAEKPGYVFAKQSLSTHNQHLPPIEIRGSVDPSHSQTV